MKAWEIFLLGLNFFTFFLMFYDKRAAQKSRARIPEKVLLGLAVLGGSAGTWLGMKIWRHKTKHTVFCFGVPLIIFLQVALLIYWRLKINGF
ncbi:MAG: DUF1294 domain-containing protein [Firmicutes bacterium]|nr:DUF1294 domain-containing protein [Bacillota bacterium]